MSFEAQACMHAKQAATPNTEDTPRTANGNLDIGYGWLVGRLEGRGAGGRKAENKSPRSEDVETSFLSLGVKAFWDFLWKGNAELNVWN